MSDSEIIGQIQNHFANSRGKVPSLPWQRMLDGFRAQRKDGKPYDAVTLYWTSPEVGMNGGDASLFVAAMKKIDAGESIPRVSGNAFPWVKLTAVGAVALFVVWGLPNLVKAHRNSGHKSLPKD